MRTVILAGSMAYAEMPSYVVFAVAKTIW